MTTTIAVSIETRDMLKKIGNKGETYDDIICRKDNGQATELIHLKQPELLS